MHVAVRDLHKRYGDFTAAAGVSFDLPRGALLTLLGPSGSGKTTTLMMMAGFVEPDVGVVEVDGRDITRLPPNKRDLGVVFQSYALFPHKTVFENVAFPLAIRRMPRNEIGSRVMRLLDLVKLSALRDRGIATLSGGQKQRVALARALVFEPALLLMDEPLAALDKKLREEMQVEIKNLQSSLGVTAVHVTHDQDEAMMMSDIIGIMNEGRLVQIGPPTQLYEKPTNRFVAEFLGGVNLLPARETRIEGDTLTAELDGGVRVPCHAPGASADGAWLGIRPERVRLLPEGAGDSLFPADIVRATYAGSTMLYELKCAPGFDLLVKLPINEDALRPSVGAKIAVGWSARSAWLLS